MVNYEEIAEQEHMQREHDANIITINKEIGKTY